MKNKKAEKGKVIRGRHFSLKDIRIIKNSVKRNFLKGRTAASIEICEKLNWVQPNGWLKDRACREVLRILEREGVIKLPPSKAPRKSKGKEKQQVFKRLDETRISAIDLNSIRLKNVKGKKEEKYWNGLVNEYHYLGFSVFVGRSIKYLIYSNEKILGAIGWSQSAWSVSCRDILLKNLGFSKAQVRGSVVNNGRFLILPWVEVPNLASRILGLSSKQIIWDWLEYYAEKPIFLETFVDPDKFNGTCYKAANWLCLGKTRGFKKCGNEFKNGQPKKLVFIYSPDKRLMKKAKASNSLLGD